jgi:predicted dehydrogenase
LGIVGTGSIAGVVARAIEGTNAVTLAAVASRRRETAESFAAHHGHPRVFDTWQQLLDCDEVDAVYVATPTSAREAICLTAAAHEKHVLAEKPFASHGSVCAITSACRAFGVAFIDATHFTHHPRTHQLRRELPERIGTLKAIYSSFFFPSMDRSNIRFNRDLEPTGAIGDMAWYNMRAVVEFASADATLVACNGFAEKDAATGALVRGAGTLLLSDGCTATWDAGFSVGTSLMDLHLLGDKGAIRLDDFVLDWAHGFPEATPGYPVGFDQRNGAVSPAGVGRVGTPSDRWQLVLLLEEFARLCAAPAGEAALASMRRSEQTQYLLDGVASALQIG